MREKHAIQKNLCTNIGPNTRKDLGTTKSDANDGWGDNELN